MRSIFTSRGAGVLLAGALAMGALAPAATAQPLPGDPPAPEFITEENWFQCDGETKAWNVNNLADETALPSWSTDAPTESVQSGAGCGNAEVLGPVLISETFDPAWQGTFTGNLQNAALELHMIAPQFTDELYFMDLNVTVTIDGVAGQTVLLEDLPLELSETGASHSVTIGLNDFGIIDDLHGPGDVEHTFRIDTQGRYYDTHNYAMVWGTTEVPAGITFNADTLGLPGFSVR